MMPLRPTQTAADEAAFVERFARLLEREGGPRIAGRIAALLLLTPEALSLEEIARRLKASRASVSTNARLLEQWGLLERIGRPGDRRDFYRANPQGAVNLLERRLEWMRRLGAVAAEGARSQAAQHPVVRERLRALSRLQAFALRNTERALRQVRGAGRARA